MSNTGFDKNTKAIRLTYRKGSYRQSRVFFPNPTLEDALEEAQDCMDDLLREGFRCDLSEAKRVRV